MAHDHAKVGEVGAHLIELKGVAIATVQSGMEIGRHVEKDWEVVKHAQLIEWIANSVMREEPNRIMYLKTLDSPFLDSTLEAVDPDRSIMQRAISRNRRRPPPVVPPVQ